MHQQYKRIFKSNNTFTAEQHLLAISEEQLQPTSISQPSTTHFLMGWLQSPINTKQPFAFQHINARQQFKSLLKQSQGRNSLRNDAQRQENKTHLKCKLDHYLNTDFSDLFNYQPPTSKGTPSSKQDFVRGQKMKGFVRKTLNSKSLYSHLSEKHTMRASSTGKSRTIDMDHCQKKSFRVSIKKRSGLSLINYPLQHQFPSEAEEQKMSIRLKYYLKKNTLSQ